MAYLDLNNKIIREKDSPFKQSVRVTDRMRQLTTKAGFIDAFWEVVKCNKITHKEAYSILELEYQTYFDSNRYQNFESFRRKRDIPNIDEDGEYFYAFIDPTENITYLGISTNPEKLFRTMLNHNNRLAFVAIRRNYNADYIFELVQDYKIGEKAYLLSPPIYNSLIGIGQVDRDAKEGLTDEAIKLLIEYRGKSGVYVFENADGTPLYIGVTIDLHSRPKSSFRERLSYYQAPVYLRFYPCNKADSLILETYFIAKHSPIFNRLGSSNIKPTLEINNLPESTRRVSANNMT